MTDADAEERARASLRAGGERVAKGRQRPRADGGTDADDRPGDGSGPTPDPFDPEDRPSAAREEVAAFIPSRLRQRFVAGFGVRATHAIEDGLTLGILFALTYVSPEVLTVLSLAIFGSSIRKPKNLLRRADAIVRTEDIAAQPLYFVVAFALGGGVVSVVGFALRGPAALPVDPAVLADLLALVGA